MLRFSRRSILATCGLSLMPAVTGCIWSFGTREPFDPHEHVDDWHDEPVRGKADSIETEQVVDSRTHNSLALECGWVCSDAVESTVAERVTLTRAVDFSYTKREGLNDGEWFVMVNRIVHFDRSNEVHLTPEITFAALLEATPRSVRASITHEDEEFSCRHPVYVVDYAEQVAP